MAKKNRCNNRQPAAAVVQPAEVKKPEDAKSEEEFNKIKEDLINSLQEEINTYEEIKAATEKEISSLEEKKNIIDGKRKSLQEEFDKLLSSKKELEKSIEDLGPQYQEKQELIDSADETVATKIQEAEEKAENITSEAESKAEKILDKAEKDKLKVLASANEKAREAWSKQADKLQEEFERLAEEESKIKAEQLNVEKLRRNLQLEQEDLKEMKEFVAAQREKYSEYNPGQIAIMQRDLEDEKNKYESLLEKYKEQNEQLNEVLVILDTIKGEVVGKNGSNTNVSVSKLIKMLQRLKSQYDELKNIYDQYDADGIKELEEKAKKVAKLESDNEVLERERNRYREEATAARNAQKELEVIKHEVDATNALNEHLLQELEAHKTALESRTGDTCPSLSKVDTETESDDFIADINVRTNRQQISSLADVVTHVKNYAGSRPKESQLFYTDNDIRAFLAGMSVSRLIILQGMSGTGKSSLPRIFAEAISGFNRLIPVESSWRDRNELLGYYNDFNKKFNAKSFTIELYRSTKENCREIPTFIVLDEMNLARIEYYFSDFLAILQEPDKQKWLIELVSSDMRTLPMELPESVKKQMKKDSPDAYAIWQKIEKSRQGDLKSETSDDEKEFLTAYLAKLGQLTGAKDLIDGRKLKITDNIWFIGTANRDESTFEISDKVYDRAQVISLNKKGVSEGKYPATKQCYLSVEALQDLFEDAQTNNKHASEVEERLNALDHVLMEKFDVSFGNRIVTQTIDFVGVYTAAKGTLVDALDYQISTKILRKVITSDDEEALNELLKSTRDYPETQRLIKKRIKELI